MSVPSSHPIKKSGQKDIWRREYIRLLTETGEPWTDLTAKHVEELCGIEELCQAGYMRGEVLRGPPDGEPKSSRTEGPTLAGRLFAEEQQEVLDKKSLWGRTN